MRVILIDTVKGVGKRHEIKNVSEGYARNYLFPRNLAMRADEKGMKELAYAAHLADKELKQLTATAKKLEADTDIRFSVAADKSGRSFGSVNKDMIFTLLLEKHLIKNKKDVRIELEKPIKTFGEHRIKILFPRGVFAMVTIHISPR